jgi:hypothetical protein
MQIKTIQKNVKHKMEEWLLSIKDDVLRKDVKENILVSGGCIASMFLNEPVNDYDVYLMDMNVLKRLAEYYASDAMTGGVKVLIMDGRNSVQLKKDYDNNEGFWGESNIEKDDNSYSICLRNLKDNQIKLYFGGNPGLKLNENKKEDELHYTPLFYSPNAISLSNSLQIVLRFNGDAETIHKTFDFIHATNYFTFKDGLVTNLEAVTSILTKQLRYQGSYYPVTSIVRVKKFLKKGFNIHAGELMKIMFQISQLDLSDPDVLDEQLIGVDIAYFNLLIEVLRNKFESDSNFKLTSGYFNELIDRIFNDADDSE